MKLIHGDAIHTNVHELYRKYYLIMTRCYNPNDKAYTYYGGRGIKVCKAWKGNYLAFKKWSLENGWKPGLVIDRIDNDKNYTPSNCRFVDRAASARNRSSSKLTIADVHQIKNLLLEGVQQKDIAIRFDVHFGTISDISCGKIWRNI